MDAVIPDAATAAIRNPANMWRPGWIPGSRISCAPRN